MDLGPSLTLLGQKYVVDYIYMSATAILIYDLCLTLHLEIRLIWLSQWSYTKVLYLIIRYLPFANAFILFLSQFTTGLSVEICSVITPLQLWLTVANIMFPEIILSIRTWAIWRGNHIIGALLVTATIATLIALAISTQHFIETLQYTPATPGFIGCYLSAGTTRLLWGSYASLIIFEALLLGLISACAFRNTRSGNSGELARVIYRDGILFYIYLLCMSTANLVMVLAITPINIIAISPAYLGAVLYSVLTARIVLNIREVGQRGVTSDTELHSAHQESLQEPALPLRFAPPER